MEQSSERRVAVSRLTERNQTAVDSERDRARDHYAT